MESVVFIYDEFNEEYPELNATQTKAEWAFNMASLIINNTPNSFICCKCSRKRLLYLLAAHILFLQNRGMGNVGSVGNASEGSVSVGYTGIDKLGKAYFSQSQYGALLWQMLAQYLSGFYVL